MINFEVYIFSIIVYACLRNVAQTIHAKIFGVSREEVASVIYNHRLPYKTLAFFLAVLPWIVPTIIS
ncbi:MAG: hypothetical protein CMJ81_03590 [Planctomycetaceae bacterium]|jgi:hypothetical protein|nr:hypothetical protein [Planctomycetaceae bacterium]MBP62996.1 hypothetical protein [Planctomycetaceae bacterium]